MNPAQYINEVLIPSHDIIKFNKLYDIARCTIKILIDDSIVQDFFLNLKEIISHFIV